MIGLIIGIVVLLVLWLLAQYIVRELGAPHIAVVIINVLFALILMILIVRAFYPSILTL